MEMWSEEKEHAVLVLELHEFPLVYEKLDKILDVQLDHRERYYTVRQICLCHERRRYQTKEMYQNNVRFVGRTTASSPEEKSKLNVFMPYIDYICMNGNTFGGKNIEIHVKGAQDIARLKRAVEAVEFDIKIQTLGRV